MRTFEGARRSRRIERMIERKLAVADWQDAHPRLYFAWLLFTAFLRMLPYLAGLALWGAVLWYLLR